MPTPSIRERALARGEQQRRDLRKLTDEQVRTIRSAYADGNASLRELGEQYEVSYVTIRGIVTYETYKDVPDLDEGDESESESA